MKPFKFAVDTYHWVQDGGAVPLATDAAIGLAGGVAIAVGGTEVDYRSADGSAGLALMSIALGGYMLREGVSMAIGDIRENAERRESNERIGHDIWPSRRDS